MPRKNAFCMQRAIPNNGAFANQARHWNKRSNRFRKYQYEFEEKRQIHSSLACGNSRFKMNEWKNLLIYKQRGNLTHKAISTWPISNLQQRISNHLNGARKSHRKRASNGCRDLGHWWHANGNQDALSLIFPMRFYAKNAGFPTKFKIINYEETVVDINVASIIRVQFESSVENATRHLFSNESYEFSSWNWQLSNFFVSWLAFIERAKNWF